MYLFYAILFNEIVFIYLLLNPSRIQKLQEKLSQLWDQAGIILPACFFLFGSIGSEFFGDF